MEHFWTILLLSGILLLCSTFPESTNALDFSQFHLPPCCYHGSQTSQYNGAPSDTKKKLHSPSSSSRKKKKVKKRKLRVPKNIEMQGSESVATTFSKNHKKRASNDPNATVVLYIDTLPEESLLNIENNTTNASIQQSNNYTLDPLLVSESVRRSYNGNLRRGKKIILPSNEKWLTHLRKALYKSFTNEPMADSIAESSDLWIRLNKARMREKHPLAPGTGPIASGIVVNSINGLELRMAAELYDTQTSPSSQSNCNCHLIHQGEIPMAYWSIRRVKSEGKNALQYVIYPVPQDLPTPPRLQSFSSPDVFFHPSPIDHNTFPTKSPVTLYTHNSIQPQGRSAFTNEILIPQNQKYPQQLQQLSSPPISIVQHPRIPTRKMARYSPPIPRRNHLQPIPANSIPYQIQQPIPVINSPSNYQYFPINQYPVYPVNLNSLDSPLQIQSRQPVIIPKGNQPPYHHGPTYGNVQTPIQNNYSSGPHSRFNYNLYKYPPRPVVVASAPVVAPRDEKTESKKSGYTFFHNLPNGHHRLVVVQPNIKQIIPTFPQQIGRRNEKQYTPRPLPLIDYLGGEHIHLEEKVSRDTQDLSKETAGPPGGGHHHDFAFVNEHNNEFIPITEYGGGGEGNLYNLYNNHITGNYQFPPYVVGRNTPSSVNGITQDENNNGVIVEPPIGEKVLTTKTTTEDPMFPASIQDILPPLLLQDGQGGDKMESPEKVVTTSKNTSGNNKVKKNNSSSTYFKRRQKDKDRLYYPLRKYKQYYVSRQADGRQNMNAPYILNF